MLKASLTAVLLTSVSLVPAASIGVVFSADVAYAKSDKAGGNGSGKGNKGGKSSAAKSKTKNSKSAKANGGSGKSRGGLRVGNDPVGKFIKRVTGQDKKKTRTAKVRSAPKVAKVKDPMHPSNLGNMNGALNANINAVLAHIRNGNTNGPVGHLAALAVANASAEGAQDVIDLRTAFDTLESELAKTPYATVEDYIAARRGVEGIDPIPEIEDALDADKDLAAAANGFGSYEDYLDAVAGQPGVEPIGALDDAIVALDGDPDPTNFVDITAEEPTPEAVAQAEADLEAQNQAEQEILSFWNKNPDTNLDEISEEEQALLDKLNQRLEAEQDAIADAIGSQDEDGANCDVAEGCEGEDLVLVAE